LDPGVLRVLEEFLILSFQSLRIRGRESIILLGLYQDLLGWRRTIQPRFPLGNIYGVKP
jgi:hypothetical protein